MASWHEFAAARPDLSELGRNLLLIEQPDAPVASGLGYLATVRADGGPRVHPVSPALVDGRLFVFILLLSPKRQDLLGDGRFALHSWPKPFEEDGFDDEEFYLSGTATPIEERGLHERVAAACGDKPDSGQVFELDLERVLHKQRGGVRYTTWKAAD